MFTHFLRLIKKLDLVGGKAGSGTSPLFILYLHYIIGSPFSLTYFILPILNSDICIVCYHLLFLLR